MDNVYKIFLLLFTSFTYLVTFHDGFKIIANSYRYGRLRVLQTLRLRIAIRLLPRYTREKMENFLDNDVEIQIQKLNRNKKNEQINALNHLEQILKYITTNSMNEKDCQNIKRIQRMIFMLLWHTKTDKDVVKRALDMLCGSVYLRPDYICPKNIDSV